MKNKKQKNFIPMKLVKKKETSKIFKQVPLSEWDIGKNNVELLKSQVGLLKRNQIQI